MTKAEAIEKIKKLLALSTSPNENEAKIAFDKAQEMMREHLVQDSEIKQKEEKIISVTKRLIDYRHHRAYDGVYKIFAIVATKFNCQAICWQHVAHVEIFGYETDVELASYLCDSIITQGKIGYRESLQRYGLHSGPSFWMGLAAGLHKRMNLAEEKQGEGLILYNKVKEHVRDAFGELKNVDEFYKEAYINEIYFNGVRSGENLSLGAGIKGQGQRQLQ